ncbi:MAG: hypothetical protein R3304_03435 [Longimicrobiales bacterium]|nr:hypothetical protein [Longimicrobiales bacterium]
MTDLTRRTLEFSRLVTRAILGVDALYRKESGDETGLAVLNMDTEGEFGAESFPSYGDAAERWTDLREEAAGLDEEDRRIYYDQLAHSTLAFIRWRDRELPFEAQLGDFLHVPVGPVPDETLDGMRDTIHALLGAMGYAGDLRARCARWEDRNRVPPDEVEEVTRLLMEEAWERTMERVVEIPAHRSDGMRVSAVTDVPFNARCDYLARTVELNVEPTLTRPALRHLAVHEGYPGHYVQFKLRETWYRDGTAPADTLLSVVNTASSSVFEGIADTGMTMVGWDERDDDRLQGLMNRYRSAIGTGAAWRLHALGCGVDDATDWLRKQALTGGEGWVRNRMAFIEAPSRAALIWSYWHGEPTVSAKWREAVAADGGMSGSGAGRDARRAFVRYLYGRMHSNRTVQMYRRD